MEELKTRLQLLEEAREAIRRELGEAHRKVREAQEACALQRKEAAELRRGLSDEGKEKEAFQRSNAELRLALKRAESERIRWGLSCRRVLFCRRASRAACR